MRTDQPNPEKEPPPFKDVELTRADVEWLLATRESAEGVGPVFSFRDFRRWGWTLASVVMVQGQTQGVDLRGAVLKEADLSELPLSMTLFNGTYLRRAHLEGVSLKDAHLEGADLGGASLEGADLGGAYLSVGTNLRVAHLEGASLRGAHLEGARISGTHLEGADLRRAHLEGAILTAVHLEGANLREAHLEGADIIRVHLEGTDLSRADWDRINQWTTTGWLAPFPQKLPPADLRGAVFDAMTRLNGTILGTVEGGSIRVADLSWGGVNLTDEHLWTPVDVLGDERVAREAAHDATHASGFQYAAETFRTAVQANRQLATVLRDQAMNEVADRFAYRAQLLRRDELWWRVRHWKELDPQNWPRVRVWASAGAVWLSLVLLWIMGDYAGFQGWSIFAALSLVLTITLILAYRRQPEFRHWAQTLGSWAGSAVLWLIAGYGYRFERTILSYLVVVGSCAVVYYGVAIGWSWPVAAQDVLAGRWGVQWHTWWVAIAESVSAFHGRGLFGGQSPRADSPQGATAAIEAVLGLVIEATFIATFSQRFLGR